MPRRTSTRAITSATPQAPYTAVEASPTSLDPNVLLLRRQWKWAAFSQFFFTFNGLFAMNDVTLIDIENDLVHSTNRVLSRIMQRLLITLTQDRKITADNWQASLRRQYVRRDPNASLLLLLGHVQSVVTDSPRGSTAPTVQTSVSSETPRNEGNDWEKGDNALVDGDMASRDTTENSYHTVELQVEDQEPEQDIPEGSEKQINWLDLPMLTRLDSLHTLTEWQFHNPHRVRSQMRDDDETAQWRIEPVGYDAKRNAYWLIGADRLWIQREPPRANVKRRRQINASEGSNKAQRQSQTSKRQRMDIQSDSNDHPSLATRSTRRKTQLQPSPHSRGGRAAKTLANQKLDAQAKDLAEFQRQMARGSISLTPKRPTGIRVSARLRGALAEEDEWQEVPEEWLTPDKDNKDKADEERPALSPINTKNIKSGLGLDDESVSDLTELSDEEVDAQPTFKSEDAIAGVTERNAEGAGATVGVASRPRLVITSKDVDEPLSLPENFIEWETVEYFHHFLEAPLLTGVQICVTLEEWESISQRFESATHYAEKALYKVLSQGIVPIIAAELREVERKRRVEEAIVHRKRSSRIAMKESVKEEERLALQKRAEEEERMSRARRLEARRQKEEAERLKREHAREQRRKERAQREQQSTAQLTASSREESIVDVVDEPSGSSAPPALDRRLDSLMLSAAPASGFASGSRTPVENWELDCEICLRRGLNQDDGVPIMCCGMCSKWQHIICHDRQDALAGRPRRDWEVEEFICKHCRLKGSRASSSSSPAELISAGASSTRASTCIPGTQSYYGHPTNYSRNLASNGHYQEPPNERYSSYEHQPDLRTSLPPHPSHAHSYSQSLPGNTNGNVTFAHYQPQQGGFSTTRPTYAVAERAQLQQARYSQSMSSHPVQATGVTAYPSSFHTLPTTHGQLRQDSPMYSRADHPHGVNGVSNHRAQAIEPYYNGHLSDWIPHLQYSQVRASNNQATVQHSGYQHPASYQHSR
ncbi:hypothetical protein F5I97DRAFT_1929415 [Phlebopus sp. FC_14]|nr:hypothetical protein F5I97DRAFT_1929415 [Phlebopus sp. FC_14]